MLTFAKIAAGAPSRQGGLADHLLSQTVPQDVADLALYYTTGQRPDPAEGAPQVDPLIMRSAEVAAAGALNDEHAFAVAVDHLLPADRPLTRPPAPAGEGEDAILPTYAWMVAVGQLDKRDAEDRLFDLDHERHGSDPEWDWKPAGERIRNKLDEAVDSADRLERSARASEESRLRGDFTLAVDWLRARRDGRLTQARMRDDQHPLVSRGLGVTAGQRITRDQINGMLGGRRADGEAIAGKRQTQTRTVTDKRTGKSKDLVPIGSYDFTLTPDKSVSVAWAFAQPAEQAAIYSSHRRAAHEAMLYIESRIGRARIGDGGKDGSEPGHIAWMAFDHYTSRPTLAVSRDENGQRITETLPVMVPGDPDLHTHHTVPNAVFCGSGRVGSLDTAAMDGLIKEAGAYYQAHLATELRRLGADVALDPETGMARLSSIPTEIRDHFSKKTRNGEEAAREYARAQGLDWDALSPARRVGLLKAGTQGSVNAAPDAETRGKLRKDDMADFDSWRTQAAALGWSYPGLTGQAVELAPRQERIERAYHESQPWIEKELNSRAVIEGADARTAALRGLIATGIEDRRDIDAVTKLYRTDGVRQYGSQTSLAWGTEEVDGRDRVRITTALHIDHEREFIRLARAGAADTSDALTPAQLRSAIRDTGIRLSPEQTQAAERLAHGGKVGVVVGVAGAGKTTLLQPLVHAWRGQGRDVHGIALAWRQADDLTDAGIDKANVKALSVFADATKSGEIQLSARSVVVVDELSLLGTRQGLELLRMQARDGFRLAMIGDDRQCQSIEAGPIIDLARKALGADQVPEILTTMRQHTEREREITGLFRAGKADAALAMKREDGTAELVPGGYREAAARVAGLVGERLRANAHDPSYTITVSAPTNADAHKVSVAIRGERRRLGQIGVDAVTLQATDGTGATNAMPLAVGDRVRLFASTKGDGLRRAIGRNGDVLTVLGVDVKGMQVRNNKSGVTGRISWPTLTDKAGRVRLAYGDVMTTHTAQGSTSTEHVYALPGGSSAVTGFSAYSSGTRHRRAAYLVLSEGAEQSAVARARPLNDLRPIGQAEIWNHVADNLSRMPTKDSAGAAIKRMRDVRHGNLRRWHQHAVQGEHGTRTGLPRQTPHEAVERSQLRRAAEPIAQSLRRGREVVAQAVEHVRDVLRPQRTIERERGPRIPM